MSARTRLVEDHLWFQKAVFYELSVRAFYDGNNDGIGDFAGLVAKLEYLEWLGVDCIWLLPFQQSPLRDGGYDISDYRTVLPDYGAVEDVALLVKEAHRRGIRVIMDLVINHTSDQHPWFQDARSSPDSEHRDWYMWSTHKESIHRSADHLCRHRDVELDMGRRLGRLLLSPLLQPSTGSQLRQPARPRGDHRRLQVLARPRYGWLPA